MSSSSTKPPSLSRSGRLRKYRHAYELCMKRINSTTATRAVKRSPRRAKRRSPRATNPQLITSGRTRKRPLNSYQKFVQHETKKSKYRELKARDRMIAVGKAWKSRSRKK